MKPIDLLKQLLNSQKEQSHKSGNWDKCEFIERKSSDDDSINIVIFNEKVGFSFNKDGNFEGIYNYKD